MNTISIPKVANYGQPTPPSESPNEILTNNGFFPNLTLAEIRHAMRIDGTVTNERLKHSALDAMQAVNRDLKTLRQQAECDGHLSLHDLDDEQLNGENRLIYLYKRAVFCLTAANLYERYRSYDSTKDGSQKADDLADTAGDLKRDYHFAVRDILNENRFIAELI